MKFIKKSITVLLSIILTLLAVVSYNADTIYKQDGYSFTDLDNNTISLCGWDNRSPELIIPNKIGNYYFAEVADYGLRGNTGITKLDVTKATNFRRIGMYAFADCSELSGEIVFPLRITDIGQSAFENCYQISSVIIYSNITTIKQQTFYNCASLSNVVLPSNIRKIEPLAFAYCGSLKSIFIPTSVNDISASSFTSCNNLTIQGYMNSYAEEYADSKGIDFEAIDAIVGDANYDKTLNIQDVTAIQKYKAGLTALSKSGLKAADVTGDGEVSVRDATQIQRYLASIITDF